jgi:signal transduction histidine kinase
MINPLLNPAYSLSPLAAAVVSLILLLVVLCNGRKTRGKWIFSGLLISMVMHNLLVFGMRISTSTEQALIWIRISTVPGFAIFVLFYHFILVFTNTKRQKYTIIIAYTILVLFAAFTPTNLIIKNLRVENYGYAPVQGPVTFILSPLVFVFLGGTVYNLVRRYKQSSSHSERNRILYLLIAILFPLLGSLLDSFTNLPPAYVWGNLIFCLICTIAILRYQLLDIRVVFKKSIVYLLISTLVAIPYIGCIFLFYQFFDKPVPAWAYLILLVLLALTLHPLWVKMQGLIDRWFYRERYDYLKALEDFSQEAHNISNLDQLSSSLTRLIARALQASSVHLLLPSISGDFSVRAYAGENTSQFGIEGYSSLLRWMQSNRSLLYRQDLDVIPQLQSLTSREIEEFKVIKAELFVPIVTKEKQLVGVLILGEKISHNPYSDEDERLIQAVTSRMASELENAHLYDLERATRKELEEQNEQKTEFLHSVSHELKTPLTAIISSSELLNDESSVDDSMRKRLIKNIRESAWSMDRRVTELLDLAKVEIPDSLPKVNGDREKLQQVLLNLLSNANKFSPSGSDILLKARKGENKVIIEIEDSAPLVTEEEKKKLFFPYYRGEDASKRERFPGIGLGLAISKQLVGLHQGEIWVETKSGKGNIFAFSLPILDGKNNNV